ncbi:16S rRNA (guanine(527)-N(7))-methyltransferase RsmG [Mariniplasma anaerobium]|uniref:Ribosomal RNA small subunit methyltransferase G n=1 Tax=Mariniplasma anaerobium TaxID=2735436 RepID=A0A7U9TJI1_9MOLU|nr:16S rRNA (guanine(527)-N(7))-methyltransferase RsmG [Mariniplasma anaerobium]BCR35315.1 ribosomal RNA small subunit methyltransferase G [Mariniplasma anaerobium]
MFKDDIKYNLNIQISDKQLSQFETYYEFLIEYNQITNLTRITDREEVFYKHFYDSLTLVKSIDMTNVRNLCDMGAGAGFPSIPLKILFPNLKITIIDSLGKRITFLKQLLKKLQITDVSIVYDRIENFALSNSEIFDVVTARALGKLPLILELGLPMTKIDGCFVAYKSSQYIDEVDQSKQALKILGGQILNIVDIKLPYSHGDRSLIVIKKTRETPKTYPRSFALIKKKTL